MLRRNLLKAFLSAPVAAAAISPGEVFASIEKIPKPFDLPDVSFRKGYDRGLIQYLMAGGDIIDDPLEPKSGVFFGHKMIMHIENSLDDSEDYTRMSMMTFRARAINAALRSFRAKHRETPIIIVHGNRIPEAKYPSYPSYFYSVDVALVPIGFDGLRKVVRNRFENI